MASISSSTSPNVDARADAGRAASTGAAASGFELGDAEGVEAAEAAEDRRRRLETVPRILGDFVWLARRADGCSFGGCGRCGHRRLGVHRQRRQLDDLAAGDGLVVQGGGRGRFGVDTRRGDRSLVDRRALCVGIVGGGRVVDALEREQGLDGDRRLDRRYAVLPFGELGRRGGRLEPHRRAHLVLGQTREQIGRRLLQEAGRELVQQAADLLGGVDEQTRFLVGAVADDLRARERVLERARQVREIGEADRRRAAGERMGERDRHFADRRGAAPSPTRRPRS